jgi:Serine hydrolase (FSH1)
MKVLCVHGWLSSPEHMKYQLKSWEQLLPEMEFLYYRGRLARPYSFNFISSFVRKFHQENKIPKTYAHLEGDIRYFLPEYPSSAEENCNGVLRELLNVLNTEKNICGLIGFSQGCFLIDMLLREIQTGRTDKYLYSDVVRPFFAVFVAYPYVAHSPVLLSVPSLHIIPRNDSIIDNPMMATMHFRNPIIMAVEGDHTIPQARAKLIDAVREVVRRGFEEWNQKHGWEAANRQIKVLSQLTGQQLSIGSLLEHLPMMTAPPLSSSTNIYGREEDPSERTETVRLDEVRMAKQPKQGELQESGESFTFVLMHNTTGVTPHQKL